MKFLDSDDHQGVALVEPEYDEELLWTPNDPSLSSQPHYGAINLEGAWDWSKGDPNVVVQVLDTGIDMSHPDLQMNIWKNPGEICGNGIDDDDNGDGVAGVAGGDGSANSGAKLMISVAFGKTAVD